jgi:histidinol-phosphate aminotransferase
LRALPTVRRVWPSAGNFLLARFDDAAMAMAACESAGLLVRDFSRYPRLEGCLRITVGTAAENRRLLAALAGVERRAARRRHG